MMLTLLCKWFCFTRNNTFFQGLAAAFSSAYHLFTVRQTCLHATHHALSWLLRRCKHIKQMDAYLVYLPAVDVLHILSTADSRDEIKVLSKPVKLVRKQNFFRYAFFIFVLLFNTPCGESKVVSIVYCSGSYFCVAQNQYTGTKSEIVRVILSWHCTTCKSMNCHTMSQCSGHDAKQHPRRVNLFLRRGSGI